MNWPRFHIDVDEAAQALRSAAEQVDDSVRSVKATAGVQQQLAKHGFKLPVKMLPKRRTMMRAAQRAIELARLPSDSSAEPIHVLSTTYLMATTAVELSEKLDRAAEQESFEKLAVETMKARVQLQPLKLVLSQILASRLNRLADLAAHVLLERHALHGACPVLVPVCRRHRVLVVVLLDVR